MMIYGNYDVGDIDDYDYKYDDDVLYNHVINLVFQ